MATAAEAAHSGLSPKDGMWKAMGAWTSLRNEMKNGQINSQPGKLLTTNFYAMMDKYGVKLSISEMGAVVRAFRGLGMQDVIKYNEFLRVCLLAGNST